MATNAYNSGTCEAETGGVCGDVKKEEPHRLLCLNAWSSESGKGVRYLRIRRNGLVGEGLSQGGALRFQKEHARFSVSAAHGSECSSRLLPQCQVCLYAAMLPAMMKKK